MSKAQAVSERMDKTLDEAAGDMMSNLGELHDVLKDLSGSDGTEVMKDVMKNDPAGAKRISAQAATLTKALLKM